MAEFENEAITNNWQMTYGLHFFLLIDSSSSIAHDGKIEALNSAVAESIPNMKYFYEKYFNMDLYIHAITFSTGAKWHIAQPTLLEEFHWQDITPGGLTNMGKAFKLLTQKFKQTDKGNFILPPVIILISNSRPSDKWQTELIKLINTPMGNKSLRIAVGIGHEVDPFVLKQFVIDGPELIFITNETDNLASKLEEALISGLIYVNVEENLERPLRAHAPVYSGTSYKPNNLLKEIN